MFSPVSGFCDRISVFCIYDTRFCTSAPRIRYFRVFVIIYTAAATVLLCYPLSNRKGDEKTLLNELYEAYFPELVKYGTRMSGSRELAEDLAQETFIKALTNSETLEDLSTSKRRAWLYRTFKNLFFDRCRRASVEERYGQYEQSEQSDFIKEAVDSGLQEVENAMLLKSISPEDRTFFQLRYFEGYSSNEISELMNVPPGTVRSRLSRCRKYLKETLEF